jgi:hypothetical protein
MSNRYVLLSEKRTGSTFVQTALNSHPQIISYDELFIMTPRKTGNMGDVKFFWDINEGFIKDEVPSYSVAGAAEQYLRDLYNKDKDKRVIFNLIYSQIKSWANNIDFVTILNNIGKYKTIHLKRDFFRTAMSMKLKELNRKKLNNESSHTMYINPSKIKSEMEVFDMHYRKYNTMFKPELCIDFEDVLPQENEEKKEKEKYGMYNLVSKEKTYMNPDMNKKICEFFKVDNVPMYSYLTKFIDNIWDYVENADNIKKYFKI